MQITHIAIIPDGNRRWAKKRALPVAAGHKAGAKQFKNIVKACWKRGIKYVTFYAFSTENWKREQNEVDALMKLLGTFLTNYKEELGEDGDKIRIHVIGDRSKLSEKLNEEIDIVEKATGENDGIIVNIAINYGSRDEILNAVRSLSEKVATGELKSGDINEEIFSNALYTGNVPDPDLLIRTSGELRISNFVLWQLAYSELYFADCYWPDFDEKELDKAIAAFNERKRRFGG